MVTRGFNPSGPYDVRKVTTVDTGGVEANADLHAQLQFTVHQLAQAVAADHVRTARQMSELIQYMNPPTIVKEIEQLAGDPNPVPWEPPSRYAWVFESVTVFPLDGVTMPTRVSIVGLRATELPLAMTAGTEQKFGLPMTNKPYITFRVTGAGALIIARARRNRESEMAGFTVE